MPGTRFTDIRRFDSLDSTNRYLLVEARSGAPEGVVAVADFQTAGRGRLGRHWEAPPGSNLLMSVLLRPELPVDHRHQAATAVALAAADAAGLEAGVALALKWPNDLLGPDGRKVAGVLAEADVAGADDAGPGGAGGPPSAVVVGIGINVNWPVADDDLPPDLAGAAGSLRMLVGEEVDRAALLGSLLVALEPRVAELGTPAGRARQAGEFRSRCATIGQAVRIELSDGWFEGTAVDVTPGGHLVVEAAGGPRTVLAGDVVHVRAPLGKGPGLGAAPGRL